MALIGYSEQALDDFERLFDFLALDDKLLAAAAVGAVTDGVSVLERHPRIGRSAEQGLRELVISHGKTGYVALYRYDATADRVLVLAIRHQREAGYEDED